MHIKIEIGENVFSLRQSTMYTLNIGRKIHALCATLNISDPVASHNMTELLCKVIDVLLGCGATVKITEGKPLDIAAGLKIFNTIAEQVNRQYLKTWAH